MKVHRVTIVLRVESELNQNQVRERLAALSEPGNPVLDKVKTAIGGSTADCKQYAVSNPPYKHW